MQFKKNHFGSGNELDLDIKFSGRNTPAHFLMLRTTTMMMMRFFSRKKNKKTSFDSVFVAFFNASKTVLGWIIAVQNGGL